VHVGFEREWTESKRAEIDNALRRILVGDGNGHWHKAPDEITVQRPLRGGRSASEVLQVTVVRGYQRSMKVVKVGPARELAGEWSAYDKLLRDASNTFARIEAVTPGVLAVQKGTDYSGLEAVVYQHVSQAHGTPSSPETLEEVARRDSDAAITVIDRFFSRARTDLYDADRKDERAALEQWWNRRLGPDITVEVTGYSPKGPRLEIGGDFRDRNATRRYPLDIRKASAALDAIIKPGDRCYITDLTATWWDGTLTGLCDRTAGVAVVGPEYKPITQIAEPIEDGGTFELYGIVRETRARARCQLVDGSLPDLKREDGVLVGPDARVRDPFLALSALLYEHRARRPTSKVHGDLNPRNVLVVDGDPYLIDYAATAVGEPMLMDFVRLEGCLARDVVAMGLTWRDHVRLQRHLAIAARLGDDAAAAIATHLDGVSVACGNAFRLLWCVRRWAREVYPDDRLAEWSDEYLRHLCLFAHLSLKWPATGPDAVRAAMAMAGVATDVLSDDPYRYWSRADLEDDGVALANLHTAAPACRIRELAGLARAGRRRGLGEDHPLEIGLAEARNAFVRSTLRAPAERIITRLRDEHDVYISLKAYIDLTGELREPIHRGTGPIPFDADLGEQSEAAVERALLRRLARDARRRIVLDDDFAPRRVLDHGDVLNLIAANQALVVLGDAGQGKSTAAREWQYQLARAIVDEDHRFTPHLPALLHAVPLAQALAGQSPDEPPLLVPDLLTDIPPEWDADAMDLGLISVIVDGLNELADDERQRVANWLISMQQTFPRTSVLVCHRQYNYVPGLLPFPTVTLDKLSPTQAKRYIDEYLRERDAPDYEQLSSRLSRLLLDDPDYQNIRDLAQTPLFLWMLVERFRTTGEAPSSRGDLFRDFSKWYLEERHHTEHGEPTSWRHGFDEKAAVLGAIGYELVQRGEIEIDKSDVSVLVPDSREADWAEILDEVITSELVEDNMGRLRFMHQSFQEYFAARHFLDLEASRAGAVEAAVLRRSWHDTLVILLGFAGEHGDLVAEIIDIGIEVDVRLTARCLRVVENPDPAVVAQFLNAQGARLRNANAGAYGHERAAEALAEFGTHEARDLLHRIADDAGAPNSARVSAIAQLAALLGQARFAATRDDLGTSLDTTLSAILPAGNPLDVRTAAIAAAVRTGRTSLSGYLSDLVDEAEPWSLVRSASEALDQLKVLRSPRLEERFTRCCHDQLDQLEAELYETSIIDRMSDLNRDRLTILRRLADPADHELVLKRRLSYGIGTEVGQILDRMIPHLPPSSGHDSIAILTEPSNPVRWAEIALSGDALLSSAAAHRLAGLGTELPSEALSLLLNATDPERIGAIAAVFMFKEPDDRPFDLARQMTDSLKNVATLEPYSCLIDALKRADMVRTSQIVALAEFAMEGVDSNLRLWFPWRHSEADVYLAEKACDAMLRAGGVELLACAKSLASEASSWLMDGNPIGVLKTVSDEAKQALSGALTEQTSASWTRRLSLTAAKVVAVPLLPRLLHLVQTMPAEFFTAWHYSYGNHDEQYASDILRAAGFLARQAFMTDQSDVGQLCSEELHRMYGEVDADTDRSRLVGLVTGLGFIGAWEPILSHLGPDEPWMHAAVRNLVLNLPPWWQAPDLTAEYGRIARWLAIALTDGRTLDPAVRSTYEKLKDEVEQRLGYHVRG
jgi:hypothetical protein